MPNAAEKDKLLKEPLRAELIQHLSKEIETLANAATNMRFRAVFVWLVGPFAVVGAFILRQPGWTPPSTDPPYGLIPLAALSYVAMGALVGYAERLIGIKCNDWRELIAQLAMKETVTLEEVESFLVDKKKSFKVLGFYLAFFVLVLVTFRTLMLLLPWASKV